MVLAQLGRQLDIVVMAVFAQQLHGGGPRRSCHGLAVQLLERGHGRVCAHGHAHLADIGGDGKRDLLLAAEVVGGGAAAQIHRAVLHQRHGVLRGDGHVFDLGAGRDLGQHLFAQLHVVAGEAVVGAYGIGHGGRAFAHAYDHLAGLLQLFQRAAGGGLGLDAGGGHGGYKGGTCQRYVRGHQAHGGSLLGKWAYRKCNAIVVRSSMVPRIACSP